MASVSANSDNKKPGSQNRVFLWAGPLGAIAFKTKAYKLTLAFRFIRVVIIMPIMPIPNNANESGSGMTLRDASAASVEEMDI